MSVDFERSTKKNCGRWGAEELAKAEAGFRGERRIGLAIGEGGIRVERGLFEDEGVRDFTRKYKTSTAVSMNKFH